MEVNTTKYIFYIDSIIKTNKMFQNRHIVILHREKKTLDELEKFIKILAIKQYGRSKIIFGVFN